MRLLQRWHAHRNDALFQNGYYLILDSVVPMALGLIVLKVLTGNFDEEQVGRATTLLAVVALLANLGTLGFANAIVRFVPAMETWHRRRYLETVLLGAGLLAAALALTFTLISPLVAPGLAFVRDSIPFALAFVAATSSVAMAQLLDAAFIAHQRAKYAFWKNGAAAALRVGLPFLFIGWAAFGAFATYAVSYVAALAVGGLWLFSRVAPAGERGLDWARVRRSFPTARANFAAEVADLAVLAGAQILVLHAYGGATAAAFYVCTRIMRLSYVAPLGIAKPLLARTATAPGAYQVQHLRALAWSLFLVTPVIGILVLAPELALSFFGSEYAAMGSAWLPWMVLSSVPFAINHLFIVRLNLEHATVELTLFSIAVAAAVLLPIAWATRGPPSGAVAIGFLFGNCLLSLYALMRQARPLQSQSHSPSNVSL